jgi:DNA invertase Pin-like site-specific DNA recombinase
MQHHGPAQRARRWMTGLILAPMVAAPTADAATAPLAAAGWHGRAIQRPEPPRSATATQPRWPKGWSAGTVRLYTGYASPRGSRRVTEVQRRLERRGYRPGPLDGRFGPRTRDAVLWFQLKHGLRQSGTVDARTISVLRTTEVPSPEPPVDAGTPVVTPQVEARNASTSANVLPWSAFALVIALGLVVIAVWLRDEVRSHANQDPDELAPVRRLTLSPEPERAVVLGYVALDREDGRERLDSATRAIDSWCERRDWELRHVIHDVGQGGDRPGLAHVLEQIRDGHARGVVVERLQDVTHSVTRIGRLLEWLDDADAFLIALDISLDTSRPAGGVAASALADVSEGKRTRVASGNRRGTGFRPAVSDDRELREQIVAMRNSGMSLQAIADTLNAAGVPTVRGGRQWRPSSVQAVTGYKRPPTRSGALPQLRRVDE